MASVGLQGLDYGQWSASGDLSGSQYRFVKQSSNANRVVGATTASAPVAVGVLQNDPKDGEEALVRFLGPTKVQAGGVFAVNDFLTINGSGQAIVTTATCVIYGYAIGAGGAQGQYAEMMLFPLSACASLGDNTP